MLSVTGLNHFYYVRDFTDMRCKHSRVLSIIRERLHREPGDGDVFIVMSRNRRIVRMFSFDNRSYSLFEKKFGVSRNFVGIIFYTRKVLLTSHYEKRLFEHASQPRVAGSDIRLLSYLWS